MSETSTEIWLERQRLEKARRDHMRVVMDAYDCDLHRPAMRALRERCAAIGHKSQTAWHSNGLGWLWRYCNQCGARVDVSGPDGEEQA